MIGIGMNFLQFSQELWNIYPRIGHPGWCAISTIGVLQVVFSDLCYWYSTLIFLMGAGCHQKEAQEKKELSWHVEVINTLIELFFSDIPLHTYLQHHCRDSSQHLFFDI